MRWILAGLAFALLVALAVLTTAIKASNVQVRAAIARRNQQILSLRVEAARREPCLRTKEGPDELLRRVRSILSRAGRPVQ